MMIFCQNIPPWWHPLLRPGGKHRTADTAGFISDFFQVREWYQVTDNIWNIAVISSLQTSGEDLLRNQDIQHPKIKPQANERGSRRVILENSLEENSIFNLFWSRLSHLITVRIQSAFLKWLIVRGGEGTSMSGFGELSGVVPLTTSPATRRQHDTARCGSASSMSESVWRGKLEKNFLDIKYFLMWNQPTTKTSNGSQILIYSLDMFPAPL